MTNENAQPAYRIHTERLVLRCWQPQDAFLLQTAIEANLAHLRPWMPWAHAEPEPIDQRVARLRGFRASFDLDKEYVYGIFSRDETSVLGGSGLHRRLGPDALEIGYWVHVGSINQGLATETAGALTRVAFEVNHVERVEIRCDPENSASARVAEKLGYQHIDTLKDDMQMADGEARDTMVWLLESAAYPRSPAHAVSLEAFDALGRPLPISS